MVGEEREGCTGRGIFASKSVVWGKNQPSTLPCELQLFPEPSLVPTCFPPSPIDHTSRVTALGSLCPPPAPTEQERAGGPCHWQNCCSFLSLTYCVILGKSHDVSEPQVSHPNSLGLYSRDRGLNINAVSDFLPKDGFLVAVGGDGDSGGKLRKGSEGGKDHPLPAICVSFLAASPVQCQPTMVGHRSWQREEAPSAGGPA